MDKVMNVIEKYVEMEAELGFQIALKESSNVLELKEKQPPIFEVSNSIENDIQTEITRRFYHKVREHIDNIKL